MRYILKMIKMDMAGVLHDPALFMQTFALLLVPFIALIVPDFAAVFLSEYTGIKDTLIAGIIRGFLVQIPLLLSAMLAGNMALEEKEEGIVKNYYVTSHGYLLWNTARIITGLLFVSGSSIIMIFLGILEMIILWPFILLYTIAVYFLIVRFSADRMQGLVTGKIAGAAMFAGSIAHILPEPAQYALTILPSYWIVKAFI